MQEKFVLSYFAAASAPGGFVSYFGQLYDPKQKVKVYILKGGPGTGKSTLMKKLAKRLDDMGEKYELFYCSSDPDSLDAIRIAKNGYVVLDGTAPHTLDPLYPGACEVIVNLGECFDAQKLFKNREDIISLAERNQECHRKVKRYINAAGSLLEDSLSVGLISSNLSKANDFAKSFVKKFPASSVSKAAEKHAFLSAVTPKGLISFEDTLLKLAKDIYVIDDRLGAVSGIIISKIKTEMLNKGYEVWSFMSPVISGKTDHIFIPELSLSVGTRNAYFKPQTLSRRVISAKRFKGEDMTPYRMRLSFNKKASDRLLQNASELLKSANDIHRELEKFYIDAMDYKKLDKITDRLLNEIMSDI